VLELLRVALLAPQLVVAILGPAPAVDAGGLDVTQGLGGDPDVLPSGRNRQRADAGQGLGVSDIRARGIVVPDARTGPDPGDPGAVWVAAEQPWDRGRIRARRKHAIEATNSGPME